MKLRICIAIIFLCALILGCIQESKNVTINNTITTPTESKGETSKAANKTSSISKLTTITPTPKIEQKNATNLSPTEAISQKPTVSYTNSSMVEDYKNRLEKIAYNLAILMNNPELRQLLLSQTCNSTYIESKIDLNEFTSLSLSYSVSLNSEMKIALKDLSEQTQYFKENSIPVDLYFPVDKHRKMFLENPNVNLLVAYDPIDENAKTVVAFYPNGSKVYLSSEKPPDIPTLIVAISEGRFEKALVTSIGTCDQGSTYMKTIRVTDVHEPWFKGKPEIYCWIVYENGFKKKLYWPEVKNKSEEYYFGCNRQIIDQWKKDEFERVAFIWYEQDISFPLKKIVIRLPWGPVEIEIGDIVIDRDDEMGSEIADWDAVPCSPHDSGKVYNTGYVEFRIAGKSGCLPKTTPTPTQTPKMIPILDISAPEFAYVGEEVEISVYSNCYMTDGQPLVCTLTYNPISDATITIKKDGVIVKTGKTDENGIFRTVFSEAGEYTITASKDGYISATTEIKVLEYVVTVTLESSIEEVITNYSS